MATPKPKTKPKKPEILRETIAADYHFTDAEKQDLGHQLASLITRRGEIEQEKSQVMSQYGSRLKEVGAQVSGLSNKITAGVEIRPTQAIVEYDVKRGMKLFFHENKAKSLIREEPMTPSDFQLPMFRKEEIESPKPPKSVIDSLIDAACKVGTGKDKPDKKGKAAKASPVGETNLGDALDKAAGGKPLPPIPFIANEISTSNAKRFMQEYQRAARAAGWPQAAINTMRDVLRACDDVVAMQATLAPHILEAGSDAPAGATTE